MEFVPFPKIPRLRRTVTITEKIDGTNGCIAIEPRGGEFDVYAQSRNRLLHGGSDNAGFARWVKEHEPSLVHLLGPGRHYGEWWGAGIQRGYGQQGKQFSLFDTRRVDIWHSSLAWDMGLRVVPLLTTQTMSDEILDACLESLRSEGSVAAPGYMNPEGIVVRHEQGGHMYKVLLDNDHLPKRLVTKAEAGAA